MGRRNRSKRNDWEEDDGLERAEMEWLMHRQASKRQKTEDTDTVEEQSADSVSVRPSNKDDSNTLKKIPTGDGPSQTNSSKDDSSENPTKQDKIERMKLKKQRQKERRRQKKAQAASAADATEQSRKESEKALHNKQKEEREKKAKMREERQPQQQYTTLAKGVKYQDLIIGKGPAVQHRKKVHVSYTLRSKSHTSGKILDSSNNFGFRLGKGEVIKGWDIGLHNMKVGGVRRLVVPPSAGYGNKDVGAGRGNDLFFQIQLLHVAP